MQSRDPSEMRAADSAALGCVASYSVSAIFSKLLIFGRFLNVLDGVNLDRTLGVLEPQSELFLKRGEDRWL